LVSGAASGAGQAPDPSATGPESTYVDPLLTQAESRRDDILEQAPGNYTPDPDQNSRERSKPTKA
jgi:hypothetical protein